MDPGSAVTGRSGALLETDGLLVRLAAPGVQRSGRTAAGQSLWGFQCDHLCLYVGCHAQW